MKLFVLLSLVAVCVVALRCLWLVRRGRAARELFALQRGLRGDAPGDTGISVLCAGVRDAAEVERLLAVDYPCLEVVVAVDGERDPALVAELMTRYRMFRVGRFPSPGGAVSGIRSLARSRRRCFGRLLLVDCAADASCRSAALDAAAAVASHDYLLPLGPGETLLPDAVERLAAAVGGAPDGRVGLVRTQPCGEALLFSREAVAAAGGFACGAWRRVPRRCRLVLWEPFLDRRCAGGGAFPAPVRAVAAGLLALCAGFSVGMAWWPVAALLLTGAVAWTAAAAAADLLAPDGGAGCPPAVEPAAAVREK